MCITDRRGRLLAAFILVAATSGALPYAVHAQGRVIVRPCAPPDARDMPSPCGVHQGAVRRASSDVRIVLDERVLRYEVTETFVNHGSSLGEADYIFPLPTGAAFQELQLQIGEEMVSGEVLDAAEARRVYEDIVRRQRDPALVEWMGRGLLRARIFPIGPGERRKVVVRYAVVAPREGDALRVDYDAGSASARRPPTGPFPLPRPVPESGPRSGAHGDAAAVDRDRGTGQLFTMTLSIPSSAGVGAPYSPTHHLDVRERAGSREVAVRDVASGPVTILLPARQGRDASIGVVAHRPRGDEDGFVLITVTPPATRAATTPRDVAFVLDVSGSMRGQKMEQARAAGHQLLATLNPGDRFRLIAFATDVRSFREGWSEVTPAALRSAARFLDDLDAAGSTNISGALTAALDVPAARGRLPLVLFLTDGDPTVGERNPEAIARSAKELRGGARVFTFGVGRDVNAALLERLAMDGGGTAQFVRPEEDVERAVSVVASRLTRPVVTGVRVYADGARLVQQQPRGELDLFAGQDLVVLARYSGSGPTDLRVEGVGASGPVRWRTRVILPSRDAGASFVARLWATQRVGWLSAERRRLGPSPELDEEIRTLATRYGIPSELTSYLVLEPGMTRSSRATSTGVTGSMGSMGSMGPGGSMPAPAPRAVAAERQFDAARSASKLRAAVTLADEVVTGTSEGRGVESRTVGGRSFVLQDSVWTDVSHEPGRQMVRVRPFGEGYFRLLALIPELREPLALGDRVVVAGRELSIEVSPDAPDILDAATLARAREGW